MGRRGLGFSEYDCNPFFKTKKPLQSIFRSAKNIGSNISDSKSIFKRRRLMSGPKSKTPLISTNVAFKDYIDSFSPSDERDSIPRKFVKQSQLGVFEFGNPKTQEDDAFFYEVKPIKKELSLSAPEFIPRYLSEASEESVTSDDVESLYEENLPEVSSNSQTSEFSQSNRDLLSSDSEEENTSDSEVISCSEEPSLITSKENLENQASKHDLTSNSESISRQVIESEIIAQPSKDGELVNHPMKTIALRIKSGGFTICPDFIDLCLNLRIIQKEKSLNDEASISMASDTQSPKFTKEEKEKWPKTNNPSITVIAGSSMRRDPQKKPKVFQNKEPRFVRKSCRKKLKTKKGSNFSTSVPIFENFNEQFKSLSCNTFFCEYFNIMHALSNHFHHSSSLVINHKGPSSKDNQRHFGNFVPQKSKPKPKDVVAYLKQANLKYPTGGGYLNLLLNDCRRNNMCLPGNQKGKIKGYGMIVKGEITVNQVSYVDGLKHNLISVSQLCDNGMDVMFKIKYCIMYKANTLIEVMRANKRGDLYLLCFETLEAKEEICLVSSVKNEEAWLWHTRFCHLNFHTLDKLVRLKLVKGLPNIKFEKDHLCSACEMGKLKRSSHKTKSDPFFDKPLQMLHVDLCGPIAKQSLNGKKYILVLVDEFSHYTWVEFVRKKSQVPMLLINLLKVRVIRNDNGTKFKNSTIEDYLTSGGITHNFSAPRTPQQNEMVERKNRTLVEAAKTMLNASGLPLTFWAEAVSTACYTQNRSLVVKHFEKTPYQLLHNIDWRTDKCLQIPRLARKISIDFDPSDELATMKNQHVKFECKIEELIKSVHALQVGCEECKGPHLTKDCPNRPMMTPEEVGRISQMLSERTQGELPMQTQVNPKVDNTKPMLMVAGATSRRTWTDIYTRKYLESDSRSKPDYAIDYDSEGFTISFEHLGLKGPIYLSNDEEEDGKQGEYAEFMIPKKNKGKEKEKEKVEEEKDELIYIAPIKHDPGSYSLPISSSKFKGLALIDTGVALNLMPVSYYDLPKDTEIPIILGRAFLHTAQANVDMCNQVSSLGYRDKRIYFNPDGEPVTHLKTPYEDPSQAYKENTDRPLLPHEHMKKTEDYPNPMYQKNESSNGSGSSKKDHRKKKGSSARRAKK
ncbi:hypothetical protein OSB04_019486 [Centaurea solstitialis]|uniref:Integrase catalytic domain-containing protein n=1 Tax=Centaurea solstitialis TaxID=347529 RepID=A0AA38SQZ1_9ASTR|nr:hypothetical protein OSB04_019486 [Centaurea solstitialis]